MDRDDWAELFYHWYNYCSVQQIMPRDTGKSHGPPNARSKRNTGTPVTRNERGYYYACNGFLLLAVRVFALIAYVCFASPTFLVFDFYHAFGDVRRTAAGGGDGCRMRFRLTAYVCFASPAFQAVSFYRAFGGAVALTRVCPDFGAVEAGLAAAAAVTVTIPTAGTAKPVLSSGNIWHTHIYQSRRSTAVSAAKGTVGGRVIIRKV